MPQRNFKGFVPNLIELTPGFSPRCRSIGLLRDRRAAGSDPQTGKNYVRCQEPLNVSYCTTLKNRGVKVAVLYTTYLPLPTNAWYNTWIAPFASQIATNMQSCASPGLYFEVSPSQGISDAMNALFKKAVAQARLTR
jgi:hypothetical protein